MPSSTNSNADAASLGKNSDASGVYFDVNGNPLVSTTFKAPTYSTQEAIGIFNKTLQSIASFKYDKKNITILANEENGNVINIVAHGTDHLGKIQDIPITIYLKAKDEDGVTFTRRVPTDWSYKNEPIYSLPLIEASNTIALALVAWSEQAARDKKDAESKLATDQKDKSKLESDDVQKVCDLLGLSKEDALAYLAAGHSVDDAAKKVAAWNLADPSQRKFMIAQDGLIGEDVSKSSEFAKQVQLATVKYKGKEQDDMYSALRRPYEDKKTTKAYIALVKENLSSTESVSAAKEGIGLKTLIVLKEFFMQSVSEVDSEKYQIVETFNKPKIYFFDRRARIYQYSFIVENTGGIGRAVLKDGRVSDTVNTRQGNPWRDIFKNTYDQYLRGTKSVEQRVKAVIHYDEVTRIGYVLSCSMNMDAQNDNLAQVSITMFVEDEQQRNANIPTGSLSPDEDVKKAEVKAIAEPKVTDTWILAKFGATIDPNSLYITEKIYNNGSAGVKTTKSPITITLLETSKNGDPKLGIPVDGTVEIEDSTFIYKHGNGNTVTTNPSQNGDPYLSTTPTGKNGNTSFKIVKAGSPIYVCVDTTCKLIQDTYAKQNGKQTLISYEFRLKNLDGKKLILSGDVVLEPKVLDIQVSSEGLMGAKTFFDQETKKTTVSLISIPGVDDISTVPQTTMKGTFNVQLIDKIGSTVVVVALPSTVESKIVFAVKNIKGGISKEDANTLSGNVLVTALNANTAKCDVTVVINADSNFNPLFTGETCELRGNTKIGDTVLDVSMIYTRKKDTVVYEVLGIFPVASVVKPRDISISAKALPLLESEFDVVFSSDPGPSILSDIQFASGSSITTVKDKGKATISTDADIFAGNSWYSSKESTTTIDQEAVSQLFPDSTSSLAKDAALTKYGVKADKDVFIATMRLILVGNLNYLDWGKSSNARGSVRKVNLSEGTSENTYLRFQFASFSGIIKIAKVGKDKDILCKFLNTNSSEYIKIDGTVPYGPVERAQAEEAKAQAREAAAAANP